MDFFTFFAILVIIICFVAYAKLGGGQKATKGVLAYTQHSALFTPAELSFYTVLLLSIDSDTTIFGKVRVADVLGVSNRLDKKLKQTALNKITSKHFDYVLVDAKTSKVKCVIELDDSSHNTKRSQIRDAFLESACESAGLKLVRFKAKSAYKKTDIEQALGFASKSATRREEAPLVHDSAAATAAKPSTILVPEINSTPSACPKCDKPLVQRSAKKGKHAGQSFLACSGYPQCRFIIQLAS
jgi:very-short-patch-repair endonuclease